MGDIIDVLQKRISAARGEIPADLVLRGARLVNLFSGEILDIDVAVYDGIFVGLGNNYKGKLEVNLEGRWVAPGLIDGHLHIESSMLVPSALAKALLVRGTTAIVADPHEIANVIGLEGVRFMIRDSSSIPFDIFFMAPSCVPATHLETAGASLKASDLEILKGETRVLGLAEMMNFPGVITGDQEVLEKIVLFRNQPLDGHCPMLGGQDLNAYLAAGIGSDHESTKRLEALEKMRGGMMLMIREGTSARNLEELLPLVNQKNAHRFCFVSDDLNAEDILKRGHLDFVIRKAIQSGLDPITAIRLATINPAGYFGLKQRGAIAPGYRADIVVLDDLNRFLVSSVYKDGIRVVHDGRLTSFPQDSNDPPFTYKPFNIKGLSPERFQIPHPGGSARVIGLVPGQLITTKLIKEVKSKDGLVHADIESDILKLCVVERHRGSGNIGLGLVHGFGLRVGAIASSVAHDSHNVVVVGVGDEEIFRAVEAVRDMGGGLAVVRGNDIIAKTPLEIAGLMSTKPLISVVRQLRAAKAAALILGCNLEEPFMSLSFLALPVIPELKLTDRGLVDVGRFEIVSLFTSQ